MDSQVRAGSVYVNAAELASLRCYPFGPARCEYSLRTAAGQMGIPFTGYRTVRDRT
jgi:hypothetical protein